MNSGIALAAAYSPAGVGPQGFHLLVIGVDKHLDKVATGGERYPRAVPLSE
jgi:hypothetical protein